MGGMNGFKDIVDLWPSPQDLANDLGVTLYAVRKWGEPGRAIPADKWVDLIAAAKRRHYRVTLDLLAEMSKKAKAA